MKKIFLLFLIPALAMFAFILSAAAQLDLPAIDEAEAADLLGRWYMNELCTEGSCVNLPDLGVTVTYDITADNLIILNAESEEPSALEWFMEDGKAYSVVAEDEEDFTLCEMSIDENGMLVVSADDGYVTYTRKEQLPEAAEEAVTDAGEKEFAGEWHLKGIMIEDRMLPAQLLETDMTLEIGAETIKLSDENGTDEGLYIIEEGKLYSIFEGTDSEGEAWEENLTAEYHNDDTLFLTFGEGTENEMIFVFSRGQNVAEPEKPVSAQAPEEAAEDGLDIFGLLEGLTSGAAGGENGLGIGSLIGQFFGGEELDLNSLISGMTSGEAGGLDLGNLLEGLTSGSTGGEGGFDLSGLMNMFGAGN